MANKSESIEEVMERCNGVSTEQKKDALSIKVNIDVSEALKGLKAVQREAKKTARALREVEELSDKRLIDSLTDDEIFDVLARRGWDSETAVLMDEYKLPVQTSVNMYKNHKPQN